MAYGPELECIEAAVSTLCDDPRRVAEEGSRRTKMQPQDPRGQCSAPER